MTNPSDNPGTHPPCSSSSTSPQPKKRIVKILARKTVAGSALSKKLNVQLKASQDQEPQNSDDSFKSATAGVEIGSSDTEQVTSSRNTTTEVISKLAENVRIDNVEESVKKIGGSVSGEATEGLVKLGQNKVGDSYNPKKKRTSKAKTPGTARANKKRKVAPSDTVESPPSRGRTTRSQLKQNEVVLQRTLEENKKKKVDKGKKKVGEPSKAVDVDEMDLVHQDEDVIAEVEVHTPKPRKAKTSTKKSTSMLKSVELSTLAKRTRSALKTKQVKIAEEEE
uniref:Uncharacterized protein n=1 Tax=Nicotiana tabacum TaxID=4097 RepID=A0A1S4B5J8_TOBAC|nr:PREDICTED: uncharacterized protein LOC107804704 [Nicotiana tabacum]